MKRRLESWIAGFMRYAEVTVSPTLFAKWGAIAAIAGVAERKVWVHTRGNPLYPNLYIILVANPGIGKTEVTRLIWKLWHGVPNHYTGTNSVNFATVIDELRDASRNIVIPGSPVLSFNSLKICANELGVLIPAYDSAFLNKLTDIYDGLPYGERRRGGAGQNTFQLANPQINMLAATTPGYMTSVLPEGAWNQGFTSRCVLIFSGEKKRVSLFADSKPNRELLDDLQHDLNLIANQVGKITFTEEAAIAIDTFDESGGPPAPTHPKLTHYNSRRTATMLKLMQIACLDRGEDLIITKHDFDLAYDWLIEAEFSMPDIFKAMTSGGDSNIIDDAWHSLWTSWVKKKQPIPKARLHMFLSARTPAYNIDNIIKAMEGAGLIVKVEINKVGICYEPQPRNIDL